MTVKKKQLRKAVYRVQKEFFATEWSINHDGGKYCSNRCVGKYKREDLTGKTFGKLTAISFDGSSVDKNGNKKYRWNVVCFCGNKRRVSTQHLKSGKAKSCGCLHLEKVSKPFGVSCVNDFYGHYRAAANKRKIVFDLAIDIFKETIMKDCHYCGSVPKLRTHGRKSINGRIPVNGIDRIDSTIGYNKDNIVPCCKKCNSMKMAFKVDDFLSHIEKLTHSKKTKARNFRHHILR